MKGGPQHAGGMERPRERDAVEVRGVGAAQWKGAGDGRKKRISEFRDWIGKRGRR